MSDFFPSLIGVRQGENLSPILFSLYLNDLETFLSDNNANGISFSISELNLSIYLKLFVILYADDTVLLSDSQKELELFEQYCTKWKLTVNTLKTKIIIFGSRIVNNLPIFTYGNKEIEIVNEYKYLGLYLSKTCSYKKQRSHC